MDLGRLKHAKYQSAKAAVNVAGGRRRHGGRDAVRGRDRAGGVSVSSRSPYLHRGPRSQTQFPKTHSDQKSTNNYPASVLYGINNKKIAIIAKIKISLWLCKCIKYKKKFLKKIITSIHNNIIIIRFYLAD